MKNGGDCMLLYHGSQIKVNEPEIRKTKYTKDFSWGFYCTVIEAQAKSWAIRKNGKGFVNVFDFKENSSLNIKRFNEVDEEWLDFIAACRSGKTHSFDIVEGPMADDTIYNYVEDYLANEISKEDFLQLAKFKRPTHQISFHTISALVCLTFLEAKEVSDYE